MQFFKLNTDRSIFVSKFISLVLLIFLLFFSNVSSSNSSVHISFEEFIKQFSSEQQEKASIIWNEIEESKQIAISKEPSVSGEEITDEELFKEITIKNKTEYREELKKIRQQLATAQKKQDNDRNVHARWKVFVDEVKDIPALGAVYLKSLKMEQQYRSYLKESENQVLSLERQIQEIRVDASLSEVSLNFTIQDWIVIVVYLIFTTILGGALAGKQASMKDFFLGGRKLAWPAVCGSIIATEISAVTFIAVACRALL